MRLWDSHQERFAKVEELFVQLFAIAFAAGLVHWYRKVDRADICPFKASLFYFSVAIGFIFLMFWYTAETIKIFCGGFVSFLIFVSVVHLLTNDSEKYQQEVSIWVNWMFGLMVGTGVLTLAIDYSNTKPMLNPMLIGFFALLFLRCTVGGKTRASGVGQGHLVLHIDFICVNVFPL